MEGLTISGLETMSGEDSSLLAGRYRVVRQLGQGGMGSVWLAEDTVLDGLEVAIKMLPSVLSQNRRAYQQLKSEALVAIKLSHSSIASVRSFEENNGNPFIVEAYIEGITLDAYLAEKGGTLSEEETLALLKPIADALDYAHAKGVVHRDVKPANVIIDKTGHPFVLDFGIAREAQETMTMVTGKLSSGTLLYMSPEQLKGSAPTAAQDVYSFATMVYECLTGRPPFYRGQVEYQIVNEQPEPLSPKFSNRESIMAGLAKDPAVRPATCAAVLAGGTAGPRIPQERSKSTGGGKIRGVLAVVVLGLFAAGGWFVYSQHLAKEREAATLKARIAEDQRAAEEAGKVGAKRPRETEEAARKVAEVRQKEDGGLPRAHAQLEKMAKKAEALQQELASFRADSMGFDARLKQSDKAYAAVDWTARPATLRSAKDLFVHYKKAVDVLEEMNEWLKANKERRDAVRAAYVELVQDLRPKADKAGTADYATDSYRSACALIERAERELRDGEFAATGATCVEARQKFKQAAAESVRNRFNTAMDSAEAAREKKAWQICLEAVDKALSLLPKDSRALDLKKEALAHLAPTLCFVAKVGDREVPATATFAGQSFAFPWLWDKNVQQGARIPQSDVAVEYTEGDKRYVGTIRSQTVDWQGPKTEVVTLTECKRPKAGDVKTITLPGGETLNLVYCPPGTFWMGSPLDEEGRNICETQHRVTLTEGFWMGQTEVTQRQWTGVMGSNPSHFKGGNLPVENVSWNDCQKFVEKAGLGLRLPTEAEWEYACRAGSTGPYAGVLDEMGWHMGNSENGTHDVGLKSPNAWGLYDMHGNVWEWCADWYGNYGSEDVKNPTGASSGGCRVNRGGSWYGNANGCRSAFRGRIFTPDEREFNMGFRVVMADAGEPRKKEQEQKAREALEEVKKLEAEITKLQNGEEHVWDDQKSARKYKASGEKLFCNSRWDEACKAFDEAKYFLRQAIKQIELDRRRRSLYTGPTATYVVKMGDTLGEIAYGHGIAIHALKELNNLQSDVLKVGMQIRVPAKAVNR